VPRFLALLADPGDALHPALGASRKARADAVAAIQVAAAGALGALGDAREAAQREALVGLLRSRDRGVVAAAHAALRGLTCIFHATPRDWGEEGPTARDLRGLGRFELVDRGFPEEARSRRGVTRLIKLLVHRDEAVRGCAGQALAAITGHAAEVRGRTPQKQRRFWQRWWDEHGARLRLPP
jgi:hypothetical protein